VPGTDVMEGCPIHMVNGIKVEGLKDAVSRLPLTSGWNRIVVCNELQGVLQLIRFFMQSNLRRQTLHHFANPSPLVVTPGRPARASVNTR
jgi:hypothetical protein